MARSSFVLSLSSRSSRNPLLVLSRCARTLLLPAVLACSMLGFTPGAMAQLGVQPTEAADGEITLDTLNIAINVPIVKKSGLIPLSFNLTYNSNLWGPSGGVWESVPAGWGNSPGDGWSNPSIPWTIGAVMGQTTMCGANDYAMYTGFLDRAGVAHALSPNIILSSTGGTIGTCTTYSSWSGVIPDGSGITIKLAYGSSGNTYSATFPDGSTTITSNCAVIPCTRTLTDVHGNTLSETYNLTGSDIITDSLGVAELTYPLHAYGTANTYTYPTSTGTASYTLNFTKETIETAFGCSGVIDYPATSSYIATSVDLPDGSSYSFTYESQVAGTITGRIASITYPSGEVVIYAYTGANNGINCADGTAIGVTRTVANDTSYSYVRSGTSFLTTTKISNVGGAANTDVYTFIQESAAPYARFLSKSVENQGASTVLRTTLFCYNGNQTNCATATAPTFPITQKDVYTSLAGMSTSSRVSTTFDSYMNLTKVALYDFGATTPTRQTVLGPYGYTWNGSLTSPTCTTAIGSGVNNKPCQVQLENGSGTRLNNTYYQYGTTTYPGSLLTNAVLTGGSTYLTTSATYNANGTVATSTDANLNKTTLTYETCNTIGNALLTRVVPPVSTLDTQFSWDSNCQGAKMLSATDPTNFSVSTTYNDPFWRPTSNTDQLTNTVNLSYYPTVPLNTQEAQMTFGSSDFDAFNTADALERPLYSQQIEASGGSWDTVQMGYSWNTTGRVTTKTMPCVAAKGSGCSSGTTTITHDALGRSLVTTDGGGGTLTTTYTGHSSGCGNSLLGCVDILVVLGPAPAGEVVKQVQKEYDGLGQVRSVCQLSSATGTTSCGQANGGTGYLTTYNYNADGTVSSIVRGSQTHSFTYDALGRTLTATYPESGTKQFFYDTAPSTPGVACSTLALLTNSSPLGNLLKTYDANGTTTCFSYDTMNRNTSIAYAGTNWDGENKYFVYDSATVHSVTMTNTLGRVAEAYTAPTSGGTKVTDEGFSYTARGEPSDVYQWSTHSGGWYHVTATYFANGALDTLAGIPGGTWTFGLDGKGRLKTAVQGTANEVTSTTYNAANQPLVITLGLGDTDTYTYDASTGRMASYDFAIKFTPVHFTGTPSWNANGTLRGLTIVDGVNSGADSEVCDYGTSSIPGYDEIGRLTRVNCMNGSTPVWGQNFTYDAYDNLSKTVPPGQTGTTWTPTYNTANNQYSQGTYDSNGNLLTDTFHTYTWNQDNHPKAITDAGMTMTFDAFGRMVEKYDGTSYWQELISPVGSIALMKGQTVSQFRVPLPGGSTALNGINFEHKDWLGSASFVSNRNRTSTAARLFSPYGEIYNNTGITGDVNFTGDRQDLVAGLYDTPNRELNPSGRWISPDPADASWNAYSYSTNPLITVDPLGLVPYRYVPGVDPSALNAFLEGVMFNGGASFIAGPDSVFVDGGCFGCDSTLGLAQFFVFGPGGTGGADCTYVLANPCGTTPQPEQKQTFSQCMGANSSNFSIAGLAQGGINAALNEMGMSGVNFQDTWWAQLLGGNAVSGILFGSPGDAALSTVTNTPGLLELAMGTGITYGRRSSTIMALNLAGQRGLPQALSSASNGLTGVLSAADSVLSLGMSFTTKLTVDTAFTAAEAAYCIYKTK